MFGSNKLARMSRRRFMEVATAMGVSATSLQYGTQEGLAQAAGEGEVPYVAYLKNKKKPDREPGEMPEREPIYKSIPRDEWAVRWTASSLQDEVARTIENQWPDQPITSLSRAMNESPTGFGVEVHYLTLEDTEGNVRKPDASMREVRERLPDKGVGVAGLGEYQSKLADIPITVVEKRQNPLNCDGEHNDDAMTEYEWDPVPGGIPCSHDATGHFCTLCAAFVDEDLGDSMVGSGHCSTADEAVIMGDATDSGGKEVIGHVRKRHDDFINIDYCIIDEDSDEQFTDTLGEVGNHGSYDERIAGIVLVDELKADKGTSTNYGMRGRTSGHRDGTIIGVGGNGYSYVTSTHDNEEGDSGGILFKEKDTTDAYVAGVVEWEINNGEDADNCGDDLKSTLAKTVENKAGGSFM